MSLNFSRLPILPLANDENMGRIYQASKQAEVVRVGGKRKVAQGFEKLDFRTLFPFFEMLDSLGENKNVDQKFRERKHRDKTNIVAMCTYIPSF